MMKGWRVLGEDFWRVPTAKENNQATVLVKASLVELLWNSPPPQPETIAYVYDLKAQPELCSQVLQCSSRFSNQFYLVSSYV